MNSSRNPSGLSRRAFLRTGGALTVVGWAMATNPAARAAAPGRKNPWAYDVSRYETTDPQLLGYTELRRFKAPRTDARRLTCDPQGRLWICAGNYLVAVDAEGRPGLEIALSAPVRCAAVAPDGTLYVSLRTHVEVLDAQGNRRAVWETPRARAWLSGLLATEDSVYVADSGNRVVWRSDRDGHVVGRLGAKDPARGIPGLVLPSPHLVVVAHPDGLLRVNNTGRHLVEAYTLEGERQSAWGKPGMGIASFCGCCNPMSLACLPDGRIVTAEKGLPRVKVYAQDGTLDCVVAGVEHFPENARASRGDTCGNTLTVSLDVAADMAGHIYILDPVTAEVRVMFPKART